MSKELEALKSIKGTIIASTRGDFGFEYYYLSDIESTKKHFDIIEQALKRNEPMKVDLETILSIRNSFFYNCPKCGKPLRRYYNYCPDCGQKLDWSNDEKTN